MEIELSGKKAKLIDIRERDTSGDMCLYGKSLCWEVELLFKDSQECMTLSLEEIKLTVEGLRSGIQEAWRVRCAEERDRIAFRKMEQEKDAKSKSDLALLREIIGLD